MNEIESIENQENKLLSVFLDRQQMDVYIQEKFKSNDSFTSLQILDRQKHQSDQSFTNQNKFNNISLNLNPNSKKVLPEISLSNFIPDEITSVQRELSKMKKVFDSNDEEDKQLDSEPLFLIEAEGNFMKFWEFFIISTIIYSAFLTPIILCLKELNLTLELIDAFIELFLICDIFLSFFIQIKDQKENLVNSSKIIRETYLGEWFFLDVITCFPASFIELLINHKSDIIVYLKWFALVRLLKIIKYPYLTSKNIIKNDRIDRLIKQFTFLIILIHIFSCFFIFIGLHSTSGKNWIDHANLSGKTLVDSYVASIYFHLLIISQIGFGAVEGVTISERIYTIFIILLVYMVFPLILISLSKIFVEEKPNDIELNSKLMIFRKFYKKFGIDRPLKQRIEKALKFENFKMFQERSKFFNNLPNNIRHQLNSFIYSQRIQSLAFFKNQSYDFILFTMPFLRHSIQKKSQTIFSIGERVEEMFLITSGKVSIKMGEEFSNLEVAVLSKNSYFGDIFLFTNKTSPFNCKVKCSKTEVFFINQNDFNRMRTHFPKHILGIIEESTRRLNFLDERKRNLMNLLEHEKSKDQLIIKLRQINTFLLERDFDEYFYHNKEIEGVNEFLVKNTFKEVQNIIEQIKNKKRLSFQMLQRPDDFIEKVLDIKKNEEVQLKKNSTKRYSVGEFSIIQPVNQRFSKFKKLQKNKTITENRKKKSILTNINNDFMKKNSRRHSDTLNSFNENFRRSKEAAEPSLLETIIKNNLFEKTPQINLLETKNVKLTKKKQFLDLLKEIYNNFKYELDLLSLKKEKEIGKKLSKLIFDNKEKNKIIECLEPQFKSKYENIKKITNKSQYTFDKLLHEGIHKKEFLISSKVSEIHYFSRKNKENYHDTIPENLKIEKSESFSLGKNFENNKTQRNKEIKNLILDDFIEISHHFNVEDRLDKIIKIFQIG